MKPVSVFIITHDSSVEMRETDKTRINKSPWSDSQWLEALVFNTTASEKRTWRRCYLDEVDALKHAIQQSSRDLELHQNIVNDRTHTLRLLNERLDMLNADTKEV